LFDYSPIDQLLTTLEQWKASKHWLLWVTVVNQIVVKRDTEKNTYKRYLHVFYTEIIFMLQIHWKKWKVRE